MEALISVVVPVYKVERYLERCVQSLLAQTYKNIEIILVNDGSPDKCPAMCDAYAEKYEKIRVIHQENKGLSGARNSGIEAARGELIAFVDSDDKWSPYFLESLYRAMKENDADISQCRWEYMHGDELKESYNPDAAYEIFTGREMIANLYIQTGAYYVVAWNKLYKKELFANIRYPEGRIHEDEATTYQLFDQAKRCVFVDNALYGYFVGSNGASITRNGFNMKKLDWRTANKERVAYFIEKDYQELVVPAIKACNDGSIDLYYKCQKACPDAKGELFEIRHGIRESIETIKKYGGGLPKQTMIGYWLFSAFPGIYRLLLKYVADMSQVEKYS